MNEDLQNKQSDLLIQSCKKYGVPGHMWEGICAHIMTGRPVGGFLTALLSNDLMGAYGKADENNIRAMHNWVMFLYNAAPVGSYGSEENVKRWRAAGGIVGMERSTMRKQIYEEEAEDDANRMEQEVADKGA